MKSKLRFSTLLITILALISCNSGKKIYNWTHSSNFIFQGTVKVCHTSTIDVDDAFNMAVVTVDKIVDGSPIFSSLTGKDITIKSKNIKTLKEGVSYAFFTRDWIFGDEIGVVEIGRIERPADTAQFNNQVKSNRIKADDKELETRLKASELVVLAQVTEIKSTNMGSSIPVTEHSPEWKIADIEIKELLRGSASSEVINVYFSSSNDVMWFLAPKFQKGQVGIWLLPKSNINLSGQNIQGRNFILIDSRNLLNVSELDRVKRLLSK